MSTAVFRKLSLSLSFCKTLTDKWITTVFPVRFFFLFSYPSYQNKELFERTREYDCFSPISLFLFFLNFAVIPEKKREGISKKQMALLALFRLLLRDSVCCHCFFLLLSLSFQCMIFFCLIQLDLSIPSQDWVRICQQKNNTLFFFLFCFKVGKTGLTDNDLLPRALSLLQADYSTQLPKHTIQKTELFLSEEELKNEEIIH